MNCSFGNGISTSNAIKYMQLRLSAEQMPSANHQPKTSEDLDQIIEHMRSRLKLLSGIGEVGVPPINRSRRWRDGFTSF
jgi:hypothetical protein